MRHRKDHPRIRGEHLYFSFHVPSDGGSSPHSRGTPASFVRSVTVGGIIPAFAGNTSPDKNSIQNCKDHPRIRGEHNSFGYGRRYGLGSSPHSRGTRMDSTKQCDIERIIPAFAGNTFISLSMFLRTEDHPRIRGEHSGFVASSTDVEGSSPHSRGTPFSGQNCLTFPGIIPAFAGNTLLFSFPLNAYQDHPRIRGEHRPGVHRNQ